MKKEVLPNIVIRVCYGILFFFLATILLRLFTRLFLVKAMNMEDNVFVHILFFDQPQLAEQDKIIEEKTDRIEIDWAALYPFEIETNVSQLTLADKLSAKISSAKTFVNTATDSLNAYATDLLIGQKYFVAGMNRVERAMGWNIPNYEEYNSVVELKDGRLTEYLSPKDVMEQAQSVANLKKFCDRLECEFLYIQSPYAICKQENADISGVLDFSNQTADALLEQLEDSGIEYLDLRECLHKDGLNHGEAFYKTDHHWKAETGLWAARSVAHYLNKTHDFNIDTSMLETNQFRYRTYSSWWLGTKGKKLTTAVVEPEDFTMIYPKYETELHFEVPELEIDKRGDFSIIYDMDCVATTKGYSADNSYSVYTYGDTAVECLHNLKNRGERGKRILLIKDSFTLVSYPFLACADGISEIDVLDVRHFTGSAEAFIEEKNPDMVIVWYDPEQIMDIDWETHRSTFDFR